MPTTEREVALVNSDIAGMFERMEPRHIALLVAKIMNPDKPMITIARELWPEMGLANRNRIIHGSRVLKVLGMVRSRPWILATIMGNKIAPVMVSVLYELALDPATKGNVRATAAKELIRLAQSTASQLASSEIEPLPIEEEDSLLASASEGDTGELENSLGGDDGDDEPDVLTAAELAALT